MKVRWEIELKTCNGGAWYQDHAMGFIAYDNKIYHCYYMQTTSQVVIYAFNDIGDYSVKTYDFDKKFGLPSSLDDRWRYKADAGNLLLYAGNKWLNISNEQITHQEDFEIEVPKYVYPSNQEYVFNNRVIAFPKERTVICTNQETKEIVWKHALKGYPYTTIEQKNGCVIFGTAGKGGALYCIDMETGKVMRDASTKGTVHYCWYENFILMKDEYGHLQLVDPFSDKQIEVVKLKNRLVDYSPMIVNREYLYAITFSNVNKNGVDKTPYITSFSLSVVQ